MNKDWAIDLIRNSPLAGDAEQLIADLLPSTRIRARRATYTLAPGESRLGGCPDLPRGLEWPRWLGSMITSVKKNGIVRTPAKETFLHFIAQLRLDDLPDIGETLLPRRGSLCFFYDVEHQPWGYDPADREAWRILYFDEPASRLVRTEHPRPDERFASHMCQLTFTAEWTLPDYTTAEDHGGHDFEWCEDVQELAKDLRGAGEGNFFEDLHHLLGHAQAIQNDMRLECQLASHGLYCGDPSGYENPRVKLLEADATDWRLLLQVDTDEQGPGWMWGDCGRVYYWMRAKDIRQQAWDTAWLVLQCS
jgi:uncharacterized protein YwqG